MDCLALVPIEAYVSDVGRARAELAIAEDRISKVVEWDRSAATYGGDDRVETRTEFGTPGLEAPPEAAKGVSEGDKDGAGEGRVASADAPRPFLWTVAELTRRL